MNCAALNNSELISAARASLWGGEPIDTAWYAVHVRSRHEFVVHDDLRRKHQTVFSPSIEKLSQWKDRQKLIRFPLFPGYLFVQVRSTPCAFLDVLKTRGVVAFVSLQPGTPTPILREEIEALKLMIASGKEIDIYPSLKEGTRVRMKNGPLKQAEGIITKRENQYLFVINIELLGRSLSVKLSANDIEAL